MVVRHYPAPHRFLCVTNDPAGIDPDIEIIPDRADFADLKSPHGGNNPACYRRLRLFHPDAAATFGERIVSLDLDTVIVGDLRPLWDRPEPFVGWTDPLYPQQLCGSMLLLTAGAKRMVWNLFDPATSPAQAAHAGYRGSDQAWISYCLPRDARWTAADGVLSWRKLNGWLPEGARIVFFHGARKPWDAGMPEWVRENWR